MTREGQQALLAEYLATAARLHAGFTFTAERIAPIMPVDPSRIDALPIEEEVLVLAFLKRFEQLEDTLNRTLKAISQTMEHGKIERLTSIDVTRRAWALGILESEKVWAAAVHARNTLAHEYPLDPHKRADQLNTAWATRETLDTTWAAIGRFVEAEGLLA